MPTYEYQCTACGHEVDYFQKITDEPLKECPVCHQASLQKLVSAAGFQLKGSGWYATDYRPKIAKEGDKKETDQKESKDTKKEGETTSSKTTSDSTSKNERGNNDTGST